MAQVEPDHPARLVGQRYKRDFRKRLRDMAGKMGASDPAFLGDALMLLIEGAFLSGQMFHGQGPSSSVAPDCSALAPVLTGQDAAIFCLGTYTGVVTDAELRRITVDYAVEFARVLHASSPDAAFSFLSGNGADPTGRSRMAFARYKGEAEKALVATGFPHVYIFRPAYIYPVEPRKEPNLSYRLLRWSYPAFRMLFPNLVIESDVLARAMVDVAVQRTGERQSVIFENRDIRALADSLRT